MIPFSPNGLSHLIQANRMRKFMGKTFSHAALGMGISLIAVAFLSCVPGTRSVYAEDGEFPQGSLRSWGEPAFGLRSSIFVERTSVSKGNPFVVSVMVENISGTRMDLKAISAFHLRNSSRLSPESTLAFGSFWCPVNLADKDSAGKSGPILASPSRFVLEKGASINATIDLGRHGWDKSNSSWWPVRDFASVVTPGNYTLRLDIQVGEGADPRWIRSNEIKVVIAK
jgi:hypothetical protein